MANLLKKAAGWLEARRVAYASSPVEYRRDNTTRPVNATVGKTSFEGLDESGFTIEADARDFLILASELGLTPKADDRVVFDGREYQVADFGADGCWRWSDDYRLTYRIHTKDIGEI